MPYSPNSDGATTVTQVPAIEITRKHLIIAVSTLRLRIPHALAGAVPAQILGKLVRTLKTGADFLRGPGLLDLPQILLDRELRAERCG